MAKLRLSNDELESSSFQGLEMEWDWEAGASERWFQKRSLGTRNIAQSPDAHRQIVSDAFDYDGSWLHHPGIGVFDKTNFRRSSKTWEEMEATIARWEFPLVQLPKKHFGRVRAEDGGRRKNLKELERGLGKLRRK